MIIDKQGIEEFFNIKTPYRKIGKYTLPYYFLVILFLTNFILNVSFVLFQHFPQGGDLAFSYLIIGIIVIILFLIASKKEPGFIMIEAEQNDFDMLKKTHPSKICFDCMVNELRRSWSNLKGRDIAKFARGVWVYTTITVPGWLTVWDLVITFGSTLSSYSCKCL